MVPYRSNKIIMLICYSVFKILCLNYYYYVFRRVFKGVE